MNDFERLWLAAPIGLFSLADAEGSAEPFSDEARAHASYYAAEKNWRLDWAVLAHALFLLLTGVPHSPRGLKFHGEARTFGVVSCGMNCVGGACILIGSPFSRASRGLGSKVSTCDGPPFM